MLPSFMSRGERIQGHGVVLHRGLLEFSLNAFIKFAEFSDKKI